jgi:hypothetical protein
MRRAITALREAENEVPEQLRANVLWHVDPDVLLLRRDTLVNLAEIFRDINTAFAGELRRGVHPLPEAQASFLAVRRDWSQRRGVSPWVHGGSPAWPLQRDIWRLGGQGHNFDTYRLGYALHRGRSAVAASRQYHPGSAYASVRNHLPHFMGVPEGQSVWKAIESSYDDWLHTKHEATLVRHLATRFS